MLSRFAPRAFAAAPAARFNAVRRMPALRTVTTDAASSHAEKDDVPEVGRSHITHELGEQWRMILTSVAGGRQAFPGQAVRRGL
jgi:pyruvate dehydrogenase E1 component alpha subunit